MSQAQDRVLMIGWEYPPHNSGGLGTACAGITKALAGANTHIYFTLPYKFNQQLGHMKLLNCFDPKWDNPIDNPPFMAYSTASSVDKKDKPIDRHQLSALPQSQLEQKVERYAQLIEQKAKGMSNQFDLIHAHDWMSFPGAINLKKKTHKPMIAHIHSTEYDRIPTGYGSQYIMHTEKEGMRFADKVIAVSFYTKHLLVEKYGINPNKIEVVHNGIFYQEHQPDKMSFAQKRPVVTFMGRLTMQKGPEYFLQLARKVIDQIPHCLFIVAGSGDMYQELLLRNAGQNLSASVLFSGFVRNKQKQKLLQRTDVFIMPSVSEPFGLVAMEASLHRVPVIVSKTAGVSEVMPSAIAVDFWDIDKMAETTALLLKDQGFALGVSSRQLADAQNNTWHNSAQKLKQIYRQIFAR